MPAKYDNIKLSETQDRRRKLTEADKKEIKRLYESNSGSMTAIGSKFGVTRHAVSLIVNPDRAAKVKQRTKDHWKDYVNREDLTKATRNLRHYKKELYEQGKLGK